MKKIFLNLVFFAIGAFLLIIILIYKNMINDRSPYSHLNKFEKELVNKIEKYSFASKKTQKNSIIYFSQLTDKKFQQIETIGCYEGDWNKTAKLPVHLEEKVNKKIGIPEDFFTTILLINKDDVIVLKLSREIGDLMPSQSCNNFENCYIKFSPEEESWQGKEYIHQNITIGEKK